MSDYRVTETATGREITKGDTSATGARHPITEGPGHAWCLDNSDPEYGETYAWMQASPDGSPAVIIQGPDGEVYIPASKLALLSRALIAAHVDSSRPDRWPRA